MHLSVKLTDSSMTMLYKVDEGYVKEDHYGIALARVIDLPPQVLEVAVKVSKALEEQMAAKKRSSKSFRTRSWAACWKTSRGPAESRWPT